MHEIEEKKNQAESELLQSIAANMEPLESLLKKCSGHWGYEDPVYRFYHQSFKVFYIQERTLEMVAKLQELAPSLPLNRWFLEIVQQGTGKTFTHEDNDHWTASTRPMLEAYLHARFFLEMICKYGKELTSPPMTIPSGWAAVLYLYNIR